MPIRKFSFRTHTKLKLKRSTWNAFLLQEICLNGISMVWNSCLKRLHLLWDKLIGGKGKESPQIGVLQKCRTVVLMSGWYDFTIGKEENDLVMLRWRPPWISRQNVFSVLLSWILIAGFKLYKHVFYVITVKDQDKPVRTFYSFIVQLRTLLHEFYCYVKLLLVPVNYAF